MTSKSISDGIEIKLSKFGIRIILTIESTMAITKFATIKLLKYLFALSISFLYKQFAINLAATELKTEAIILAYETKSFASPIYP